jgi:monofunctional biosynthetic peptidoglycan transglycosylase
MKNAFTYAVKVIAAVFVVYVLGVLALGALYRNITPVSTIMIADLLSFNWVENDWVSINKMSNNVKRAVVTAEDGRFCQHNGVDWEAMHDAVEDALDNGESKGASTISMQVAKNLFLWPQRSYVRKALEVPIAIYLDFIWPKKRMLEVYLNIAELGDGIYGVESAAQVYFGKSADGLSQREAVMLAASLPSPLRRNPNRITSGYNKYISIIEGRLKKGGAYISCISNTR